MAEKQEKTGDEIIMTGSPHWSSYFFSAVLGCLLVLALSAGALVTGLQHFEIIDLDFFRALPPQVNDYLLYIYYVLFGFAVLCFLWLMVTWLRLKLTRYRITTKEMSKITGVLSLVSREVPIDGIRTIDVRQTLWQRILGIGDILVATAGTSGFEMTLESVKHPFELRDRIQSHMSAYKASDD